MWPYSILIFGSAEVVVCDLDTFIAEILKYIGLEWKFLVRSLEFEQSDIDVIEKRDEFDLKEQIYQMFYKWKRREGNTATTAHLLAAIRNAELRELLRTLRKKGFIVPISRGVLE